mgnify:CR=1 FL=1
MKVVDVRLREVLSIPSPDSTRFFTSPAALLFSCLSIPSPDSTAGSVLGLTQTAYTLLSIPSPDSTGFHVPHRRTAPDQGCQLSIPSPDSTVCGVLQTQQIPAVSLSIPSPDSTTVQDAVAIGGAFIYDFQFLHRIPRRRPSGRVPERFRHTFQFLHRIPLKMG